MNSALTRNAFGVTLNLGAGLSQEPDGAVTAPGGTLVRQQAFPVAAGQTSFGLDTPPAGGVAVAVNGQIQDPTQDFVVSGQQVQWVSNDFELGVGDVVVATYQAA